MENLFYINNIGVFSVSLFGLIKGIEKADRQRGRLFFGDGDL